MGVWSKSTVHAVFLSFLPIFSFAAAATSDDLFNDYFSNVLAGPPCFAQTYDDAHLQSHPNQRVRSIEINLSKANSDGTPNSADRFELGFGVMLTSSEDWYGQAATCKTSETDFQCYLDGDGGLFRLIPEKGGRLRLEAGDTGLSLEGPDTDVELSGKNGIDRVFELVPSKGECEAALNYFGSAND